MKHTISCIDIYNSIFYHDLASSSEDNKKLKMKVKLPTTVSFIVFYNGKEVRNFIDIDKAIEMYNSL